MDALFNYWIALEYKNMKRPELARSLSCPCHHLHVCVYKILNMIVQSSVSQAQLNMPTSVNSSSFIIIII